MDRRDALRSSVQQTHDDLAARLLRVRTLTPTPGQPRKAFEAIDTFLARASRHLGAVDAVLLPTARQRLDGGSHVVHDYLHSARQLEVALAHAKARVYGSVLEAGHPWSAVWDDVAATLAAHRRLEVGLAEQLTAVTGPGEVGALALQLHRTEARAPTRPHPYTPHTGLPGRVTRRVLRAVDAFWDTAEGRMSESPVPKPHKKPGLVAQYFLADPRFDEAGSGEPKDRRA